VSRIHRRVASRPAEPHHRSRLGHDLPRAREVAADTGPARGDRDTTPRDDDTVATDAMRFHRLMRAAEHRSGLLTVGASAAEGVDRRTLARLAKRGLLVRHCPGIYRPAGRAPSPRDEIRAAVAATGGIVSYWSAALWWGFDGGDGTRAHVTVSYRRRPRSREGFVVHSTTRDLKTISTVRDGVRVTTPGQTLLDLCAVCNDEAVPRAFLGHCLSHRLISASQLERFLRKQPLRAPGTRRLRALVRLVGGGTADSSAELELMSALRKADIPAPRLQFVVKHNGRFVARVDTAWPDLHVVLEIDGYRYHSDPRTFVHDRIRQNALVNAGYTVLRTTPAEIRSDANGLCHTVERALDRARRARAQAASPTRLS
jgi:very-short-patch-repair endonuclease